MSRRPGRLTFSAAVVLLAGVVALPALAAEGRIPIPFTSPPTTPVVITTPGHYILTRNLSPTGPGNTIEIAVPGTGADVDLDLNGFLVTGNAGASVINVAGGGTSEVKIHDGALQGGANGINVPGSPRQVIIERVRSGNATTNGFNLGAAVNAVVRNCVINAGTNGINFGPGPSQQATIEGNLIQQCLTSINVSGGGASVIIRKNQILQTGTGINLNPVIGALVEENMIRVEGSTGIALRGTSNAVKVFDNVINRCSAAGILIEPGSFGNLIWKNVIREVVGAGVAIHVFGDTNQIEGNIMNNNACGLVFAAGADNNVYRGNTARLNTGGAACGAGPCPPNFTNLGAVNSTPGDNFIPSGVAPCN